MGYEWRVFFPIPPPHAKSTDVWHILGTRTPVFSEKRTDKYIVCTRDVGIKLRGSLEVLEVKVRLSMDALGIECWEKIARTRIEPPRDLRIGVVQLLEKLAGQHARHRDVLLTAARSLSAVPEIRTIGLSKSRKSGGCKGVTVEQTDIVLLQDPDSNPEPNPSSNPNPNPSPDPSPNPNPNPGDSQPKVNSGSDLPPPSSDNPLDADSTVAQSKQPTGAVVEKEGGREGPHKCTCWRSVSMEHERADKLAALLSSIGVRKGTLPPAFQEVASTSMGYPEFLLSL